VTRLDARWAIGLFLVAAGARLAFVIAVTRPTFPHGGTLPFNDMLFYHDTAKALADGRGYISFDAQPTARWPPAFPFLLSLVYRVAGAKPGAGEAMNALLGGWWRSAASAGRRPRSQGWRWRCSRGRS
jgi:hypothetical protein